MLWNSQSEDKPFMSCDEAPYCRLWQSSVSLPTHIAACKQHNIEPSHVDHRSMHSTMSLPTQICLYPVCCCPSCQPLLTSPPQCHESQSWAQSPITFSCTRWKKWTEPLFVSRFGKQAFTCHRQVCEPAQIAYSSMATAPQVHFCIVQPSHLP
jgi:hypothetical protein